MAMYEHNARKINAMMAAIDPQAKADIVALGDIDAMLRIADRLDRGGFVGMLGDRTLSDEPLQSVRLLGERAHLPVGPMRAAAILRRPVIFMAGLYRGGNRYHVVFEPIADFSTTPAGQRDERHRERDRALRRAARSLLPQRSLQLVQFLRLLARAQPTNRCMSGAHSAIAALLLSRPASLALAASSAPGRSRRADAATGGAPPRRGELRRAAFSRSSRSGRPNPTVS